MPNQDEIEIPLKLDLTPFKRDLQTAHQLLNSLQSRMSNMGLGGGGGGQPSPNPVNQVRSNPNYFNVPGWGNGKNSSFGSRVLGLLGSTRLNLGMASPLVGRIAGLFGPLAAPITALAGTFGGLEMAADRAAKALTAISDLQYKTGATGVETQRLRGLGGVLGLDAGAGARAFAEQISTNGQAMAFSGMHDIGGPFGRLDKATQFLDFLDKLRKMPEAQAMRTARATGTEDYLRVRDFSEATWRQMREEAGMRNQFGDSKEGAEQAADFNTQIEKLKENLEDLASVVLPVVNLGLRGINGVLRFFLTDHMAGQTDIFGNRHKGAGQSSTQKLQDSQDKLADSTDRLATVMQQGLHIFGSSAAAAAGVIPRAYQQGTSARLYDMRNRINLGAFGSA